MTPTRAFTASLLHRLQHGLSDLPIELVYTPHERWPLPHPRVHSTPSRTLRVSVLDSSFNPPTLAHLALANSRRPSYSQNTHDSLSSVHEDNSDYDAKLLLLSVRNADKSLKPTDASYIQRLEMMFLLAKDINRDAYGDRGTTSTHSSPSDSSVTPEEEANVAVAIIDEPTFVGKSRILLAFLQRRLTSLTLSPTAPPPHESPHPMPVEKSTSSQDSIQPQPQLTFLLGFDTLERLLSPRYYTFSSSDPTTQMLSSLRKFFSHSPEGDDSRVVCARRGASPSDIAIPTNLNQNQDQEQPENTKESPPIPGNPTPGLAEEFITSQGIVLIDIGEDERTFSSTAVREMIERRDAGWRGLVPGRIGEYVERERLYVGGGES